MSGDLVLYPALVVGTTVAHLAATQQREGELLPQLVPVCPPGSEARPPLELIPEGVPVAWCGDCRAYAAELGADLPSWRSPTPSDE